MLKNELKIAFLCSVLAFASIGQSFAVEIPLTQIPWTAANRIWTPTGHPSIDRNRFGHPIRIGGKEYHSGIVGHSGMSLVYNLSGKAKRLTLLVGINDEDDPRKSYSGRDVAFAAVIFQLNRKEVLRKVVRFGAPAVPVSIDLRGCTQLEIRGDYGKHGFLRQRVALVNPVVETGDPNALRRVAEEWRRKIIREQTAVPAFLPAPANWKKIKAEKITFHGFLHAYRFSTESMTLVIVPECGGRIYSFSGKNGRNVLSCRLDGKHWKLPEYGVKKYTGGFYTQPEPRNYFLPPDPFLNFGVYRIEFPAEGEILLKSPPSWILFLRYEYRIKLHTDAAKIEIESTHVNLAPFAREAGIWSLTTVSSSGLRRIVLPAEADDAPRRSCFRMKAPSSWYSRTPNGIEFILPNEFSRLLGPHDFLEYKYFPCVNRISADIGNSFYTKNFEVPKSAWRQMGDFYPAHIFVGGNVCELECHGPVLEIPPGGTISLKESWELNPCPIQMKQ